MISQRMYKLLAALPRDYSMVSYEELIKKSGLTKDEFIECKIANLSLSNNGVGLFFTTNEFEPEKNSVGLSDRGLAELEQYEQQIDDQKATEKSIKLANLTLYCAILTLLAAIATLIVTVIK